jgi:glycosyltransferase involved in cell wall biosynthesis
MEPYRGFPQAMAAFAEVLRRRPRTHLLVAGTDSVTYGRPRTDGRTYRDVALEQHPILAGPRVHWLGHLEPLRYRALLRCSAAHVYLTVPFVLSWSLLEAMACAAPIVGSATGPVQDVMADTHEGVMVNFFDQAGLADAICGMVENSETAKAIGLAARLRVEENFALKRLLPRHLDLLSKMNNGNS